MFSNVGKVELDLTGRMNEASYTQASATRPTANESATGKLEDIAKAPDTKADQGAEKAGNQMSDVSLKFKINEETKDVTILIVDRASKKVVRTIPPEEMSKMKPGELLEMFA